MIIIAVMIILAIAAPLMTGDPTRVDPLSALLPPSAQHPFGTDTTGRDLLTQVLWGGRVILVIAAVASLIGLLTGMIIGILCGYFRPVDNIVMRIMDGLMSFPGIVLIVALVGVLGANPIAVTIGLAITIVPGTARLVRPAALSTRELTMVESARAAGAGPMWILRKYVAPETTSIMLVHSSFAMVGAVLAVTALSFLGVGLSPSIPSWGNSLASAQQYFSIAWWLSIFPGLAIVITVTALVLIGDALRDAFDPRVMRKVAKK